MVKTSEHSRTSQAADVELLTASTVSFTDRANARRRKNVREGRKALTSVRRR